MRTTLFILLVALLVGSVASAQIVKQTTTLINGTTFGKYTFTGAVSDIPVAYNGTAHPELQGCFPDSIRLSWYAKGVSSNDSVGVKFTLAQKLMAGAAYITYNAQDSCKARETDYKSISTVTHWQPGDLLSVKADSLGSTSVNRNSYQGYQLWLRLERFFKK